MAKFGAMIALALFGILLVSANEEPPQVPDGELAVSLYAKDSTNFEVLKNRQITYTLTNPVGVKQTFNEKTNENGSITIYLDKAEYNLHGEIDDENTNGKDYAATITIKADKDGAQRILFQPVSSLSLLVVNQENQAVPNAKVELKCVKDLYHPSELNQISEFTTDESGSLFIKSLPAGSCQITAKYEQKIIVETIESRRGEYKQITLTLNQGIDKTNTYTQLLGTLAALSLITALWFYNKRKKSRNAPTPPPQNTLEAKVQKHDKNNGRLKDIYETLSPREKQIIEILTSREEKVKQADIYRETLIPKATLSRTLEELQKKNTIKLTPFGKINYVELSDWILGEEETKKQ